MKQVTKIGQQQLEALARKYNLSLEAVTTLMYTVHQGNGTQAQFNHPELGGMGQWMRGGMIMVGDMFNNQLKQTVSNLCEELSSLVFDPSFWAEATNKKPAPSKNKASENPNWWPAAYGVPSSSGAQNQFSYALFSNIKRLAVKENNQVTLYDTLYFDIHGFSQQQGNSSAQLRISTFQGEITLNDLKVVQEA